MAGGPRTQSRNRNQGLGVKKVGFRNISNVSKLRRTWGCGCAYWVISTRVVQDSHVISVSIPHWSHDHVG